MCCGVQVLFFSTQHRELLMEKREKQTDRQTEKQTDIQTERQRETEREREIDIIKCQCDEAVYTVYWRAIP